MKRLISHMNSLLVVKKSRFEDNSRNPWSILQPSAAPSTTTSTSAAAGTNKLRDDPELAHDAFFAEYPRVAFTECTTYEYVPNEEPSYPTLFEALHGWYRQPAENHDSDAPTTFLAPTNEKTEGGLDQRHVTNDTIKFSACQLLTTSSCHDSQTKQHL